MFGYPSHDYIKHNPADSLRKPVLTEGEYADFVQANELKPEHFARTTEAVSQTLNPQPRD